MELTKKQVAGIIKVLKQGKKARPVLENIAAQTIDNQQVLVLTNSYQAITIPTKLETGFIEFKTIETWYKLANSKDTINLDTLETVESLSVSYPDLNNVMKSKHESVDTIALDARKLDLAQTILGQDGVRLQFNGKFGIMEVSHPETGIKGIVLPMRMN